MNRKKPADRLSHQVVFRCTEKQYKAVVRLAKKAKTTMSRISAQAIDELVARERAKK